MGGPEGPTVEMQESVPRDPKGIRVYNSNAGTKCRHGVASFISTKIGVGFRAKNWNRRCTCHINQ